MAVTPRRRAPHRAGHACRVSIPAIVAFVHMASADSNKAKRHQRGCFCVRECRAQALICSCCDRGQVYCAGDCAQRARHRSQTAAGRRYQSSRRGRHAACRSGAALPGAHSKKVTHQGSPPPPPDDLLPPGSPMIASDAASSDDRPPGDRPRTATGAVAGVPVSSARGSCAAAVRRRGPAATRPDRTRTW